LKEFRKSQGTGYMEVVIVLFVIFFIIIASVVYFKKMVVNSRNLRRMQDMNRVKTAFQIYHNQKGSYPVCGSLNAESQDYFGATKKCFKELEDILVKGEYINKLPQDPLAEEDYYYYYSSDGSQAFLVYKLESFVGEERIDFLKMK